MTVAITHFALWEYQLLIDLPTELLGELGGRQAAKGKASRSLDNPQDFKNIKVIEKLNNVKNDIVDTLSW